MTKHYCDRCAAEVHSTTQIFKLNSRGNLRIDQVEVMISETNQFGHKLDLCKACIISIVTEQ